MLFAAYVVFCMYTMLLHSSPAHIRDPGNVSHTIHNLHLAVHSMNSLPPQATLAKKLLSDAVSNILPSQDVTNVMTVGSYDLQLSRESMANIFANYTVSCCYSVLEITEPRSPLYYSHPCSVSQAILPRQRIRMLVLVVWSALY